MKNYNKHCNIKINEEKARRQKIRATFYVKLTLIIVFSRVTNFSQVWVSSKSITIKTGHFSVCLFFAQKKNKLQSETLNLNFRMQRREV